MKILTLWIIMTLWIFEADQEKWPIKQLVKQENKKTKKKNFAKL